MIATDRFIFLHLHKSGGSFVNEFLLRFLPEARQIGYHLPRSLIPQSLSHLPVLGFVRNPWSYYVSWYSFQARMPRPNALFRILSDGGRLEFEATVRNMLDLGTSSAKLNEIVAALPQQYGASGLNLPGFALAAIRGSSRGFYGFLYNYLYDGPGMRLIRRMERLRDELPSMLTAVGQPVSASMRAYVVDQPAKNSSEHAAYVQYYGDALRELVAERDAEIIAQHGYRFGE